MNARNHWNTQRFDPRKQRMRPLERLRQNRKIAHRVKFADIGTGDKTVVLATEQDHANQFLALRQCLKARDQALQFRDRLAAQRVDR